MPGRRQYGPAQSDAVVEAELRLLERFWCDPAAARIIRDASHAIAFSCAAEAREAARQRRCRRRQGYVGDCSVHSLPPEKAREEQAQWRQEAAATTSQAP